jgi:pyridinium-3,5-bisthiocarboxylic acid mononucleotide nickel chelatase
MIAYFDCFSGISGDMTLGALIDAGLPLSDLQEQLSRVKLTGYRLEVRERREGSIQGTQLDVIVDEIEQPARHLGDIRRLLQDSSLDVAIVERAVAVFSRLARAEAAVHGVAAEAVHFHEVGAVDAIVDVVGAVAGLSLLGVDAVYASSLPLGQGAIESRHGILPLPAPGTLEILAEVGAPTRPIASDRELVTPTGAALVAELALFKQPPLRLRRVGYGFGRRKLAWPNCLRLWLGEPLEARLAADVVCLLEANIDDISGEALGYAMERLFLAGALDVFFQAIQMKKNRPGVLLGVLAGEAQVHELAAVILAETTTLGVRVGRRERFVADRQAAVAQTALGPVAVKIKRVGERTVVSPEYDDAARLARERGIPLAEVYLAVQRSDPPDP